MEAKCGFCNLFGDKLHCGNCRLFNQAQAAFTPREIKCSVQELIKTCESDNVEEHFSVGDYKHIKLPYHCLSINLSKEAFDDYSRSSFPERLWHH